MADNRVLRLDNQGVLELYSDDATAEGKKISLQAPASLAADWTLTLPGDDGGAGEVLTTDGSGTASWTGSLTALTVTTLTSSTVSLTNQGVLELYELTANGTNKITLQAPADLAGDLTFTLPPTDGAADELLRTDGNGVLTWVNTVTAFDIDALTSDGITILNEGTLSLREATGGGTHAVSLKAPAALAGDWTLTLPPDDGDADEVLRTDGSGVTTWVSTLTAFDVDALTSDGITILDQGTLSLREASGGGTSAISIRAPAALAASQTLTLPDALPGAGTTGFLRTDESGDCSWETSTATLQGAYDAGEDIALSSGNVIDITQANNEGMLTLTKTGAGAGVCLAIDNDGTGTGLYVKQDGVAAGISIEQNAAAVALYIAKATGVGNCIDIVNGGSGYDIDGDSSAWYVRPGGGVKLQGLWSVRSDETIDASGVITVTVDQYYIVVDTNGGAASDDLDTITMTGVQDGQRILLRAANDARTVVLTQSGNMDLPWGSTTASLGDTSAWVSLVYNGDTSKWEFYGYRSNRS